MGLGHISKLTHETEVADYAFILPRVESGRPSGGYNIVFQLCSRLSRDGFRVMIAYMSASDFFLFRELGDKELLPRKELLRKILLFSKPHNFPVIKILEQAILLFNKIVWHIAGDDYDFSLLKGIPKYLLQYNSLDLVTSKKIVATSWRTAYVADHLSRTQFRDQKLESCYYLIQNSEDDKRFSGRFSIFASKTYEFKSLKKIVINKTLLKRFATDNPVQINIGIDIEKFRLINPIENRPPLSLLIPLRLNPSKGADIGLETLKILRQEVSGIDIYAFGDIDPSGIPEYIHYSYRPNNKELLALYNKSSIFVLPSIVEGMPAPPLEAMNCGNAVVVTDNGGSNEYIIDGENGIIVPNKDPILLAAGVKKLIFNDVLRIKIAKQGQKTASSYTYETMYKEFREYTIHK
ncbi:MAG: hypothetical protein B2I17_02180 [Thermoplasmatales archaeon B_DKE]|nr:MAG: hypothetical protein B2I17_02180 [Thermoplasmatales archaeon B_DKE]